MICQQALREDGLALVQDDGPGSSLVPRFKLTNTNELLARTFEPLKAIVPGYLYGGFTILAGRQKLGKTWLAIDWALAVSTGGVAMGSIDCEPGDVLYVDMENGPRRIQARILSLFPPGQDLPDLSRLDWVTEAPQLDRGFIDRLEHWRLSVGDPRLVVIDVLQRIKPPGNKNQNAYESDYSTWAPLQAWATKHGVCVLGLHHTKKGGADDPLEALSGSNGLSACADTTIVLDSNTNGKTLYVRGRDIEERETAVTFVTGQWTILGNAADVRRSDERSVILAAINDNNGPMTPSELTAATGRPSGNIRQLLWKMVKAGELYKLGRGRYWVHSLDPDNNDNIDNEGEDEG
jgi:RecA-family ATPase